MPKRLGKFELPSKLTKIEEGSTPTYAKFIAEPFEAGYGHTVGNSLRRVLLSSIEGAAISSIKIDGVNHEFQSIDGVVEDVTDIVLNLKKVLIVSHKRETISLTVKANKIGPVTAAVRVVSWSHHGRVRSEAAFAALAGTCPIPASSGNTTRHRLNRGGDRRLNWAIHTIALGRMAHDPDTKAYIARRVAEGKTKREAMRCHKRYLTRSLHRTLENSPAMAA